MGIRTALEYAIFPETGATWCGIGVAAFVIRRVQHRVKHLKPVVDRLIAAGRRDKKVARTGRRDIGNPDRLRLITPQLLAGSF
jgi:hypothetical protein